MYSGYYGTFIAHLFSLISSIWSIFEVQKCKIPTSIQKLLFTSLLTVFFNSILSLLRYGKFKYFIKGSQINEFPGLADGYKLRKFHVVSLNISSIFFLTLISYALQLVAKLSMLWVCFPILNIIPFYRNVSKLDYRSKRKGSDIIVVLNCLIFLYAAIYSENFYAIAFILSFGFGYVYVGDCGYFLDTEVPSIDIYQYVQCFLCLFTVNAFCE